MTVNLLQSFFLSHVEDAFFQSMWKDKVQRFFLRTGTVLNCRIKLKLKVIYCKEKTKIQNNEF